MRDRSDGQSFHASSRPLTADANATTSMRGYVFGVSTSSTPWINSATHIARYGKTGWIHSRPNPDNAWLMAQGQSTGEEVALHGSSQLTWHGTRFWFETLIGVRYLYRRAFTATFHKDVLPSQPASITVPSSVTHGQTVAISWEEATESNNYRLQIRHQNSSGWNAWTDVGTTTTTTSRNAEVSSFSSWFNVQFQVRAENDSGNSAWRTSSVVPFAVAPTIPASISYPNPGNAGSNISIAWSSVTGATNYDLEQRQRASGAWGSWVSVVSETTNTSRSETLTTGTWVEMFQYRVRARNAAGVSGWREGAEATLVHPPGVPSWISYPSSASAGSTISVTWEAVTGATSYTLEQRTRSNSGVWGAWTSAGTSTTSTSSSQTLTTTTTIDRFQFRVRASNTVGNSAWREGVEATLTHQPPDTPLSILYSSPVNAGSTIAISWSWVSGATSYTLERRQRNNGVWETWAAVVSSTADTSSNQTASTTTTIDRTQFRVRANNAAGSSGWQEGIEITIIHPPNAPASISYPNPVNTGGTIIITWDTSTGATGYDLQWRYRVSGAWGTWGNLATGTTATSQNDSITTATTHELVQYRVRANNGAGSSAWTQGAESTIRFVPIVSASPITRDWGTGNVSVVVTVSGATSVRHIWSTSTTKPATGWTTSALTGFTATQNQEGSWFLHVEAINVIGTADERYGMYRIDITNPTVVFGTNGNETLAQSHSTTVSVSDTLSGVNTRQFVWATSTTTPATGWQAFSEGASIATPAATTNDLFLHIRATDVAGNTANAVSNRFRLDNTAPTVTFSTNGSETFTQSHSTIVTVTDALSGVATRQFVWATSTATPATGWQAFSEGASITSKTP